MSIGKRRTRIEIWETTYTRDTIGGEIPTPAMVKATWAEVTTSVGIRSQDNRAVRNTQGVSFVIRTDSYPITTANNIQYDGSVYTIHSIQTDVLNKLTTIIAWHQA